LTAPPSASNAIPPDAPGAPPARWKLCTPASKVPMPWLLSGLVKKSDLAYSEARASLPAGFLGGQVALVHGQAGRSPPRPASRAARMWSP